MALISDPSVPAESPDASNVAQIGANARVDQIAVGTGITQTKIIGFTAEQVEVLLSRIRTEFQPKAFDGRSPYVGLASFREQDADRFFGRETLIEDLIERVQKSRCVVIAGPSGSGKSSLVRAGLIPALKKGQVPGSEYWMYGILKPGRAPLEELGRVAAGFAKAPKARRELQEARVTDPTTLHEWVEIALDDDPARRAVILVDQFEEIFTQVPREHESERAAFLSLLTYAATVEKGRVLVLLTLRSDFVANCASYPDLNALVNQQFLQVGAMTPDELVSAIARPAYQVGLRVDPALIAQVVNDVRGEPGALPLMQFALQDLFEAEKSKGELTLDGYLARGGLHKALARHADEEFAKLDESEKELARTIFSGLIQVGRGTQDTKRTALLDELVPAGEDARRVKNLVTELADARLLTTDVQDGKETVTLAHERLLEAWDWLGRLVNENRDAIALQNEIAQDAQDWNQAVKSSDYLYRGARLATVQEKLEQKKLVLSGLAQAFVEASIKANEETARQQEAQRQRELDSAKRIAEQAQALAQAQQQRAEVEEQARRDSERLNQELEQQLRVSDARRLAVQAVSAAEQNPGQALLLAVEAMRRDDSLEVRNSFLRVLNAHSLLRRYLLTGSESASCVIFSPDGALFATGGRNGQVRLWNAQTLQPVGIPMPHDDEIKALAFTTDHSTLRTITSVGTATLWSVETQQTVGTPIAAAQKPDCVALSADARTAAFGKDDTVILMDLAAGQPVGTPLVREKSAKLSMLGQNTTCMSFNADGSLLAVGYTDGLLILWDSKTFTTRGAPLTDHQTKDNPLTSYASPYQKQVEVEALCFSPEGLLISGDSSGNILLFKPGGNTLPKTQDKTELGYTFTKSIEHNASISRLAVDSTTKYLAAGDLNGTVQVWHLEIFIPPPPPTQPTDEVPSETVTNPPTESGIIIQGGNLHILGGDFIVSSDKVEPLGPPLIGHDVMVTSLAWHPTIPNFLISCSQDATLIWDIGNARWVGKQVCGRSDTVLGIGFTAAGQLVRFVDDDGLIHVLDVVKGGMLGKSFTGYSDNVRAMALNPDGENVAVLGKDNAVYITDLDRRARIGHPLQADGSSPLGIQFSRSGSVLAALSWDEFVLWDLKTQEQLGAFKLESLASPAGAADDTGRDLIPIPYEDFVVLVDARTGSAVRRLESVSLQGFSYAVFCPRDPVLAVGKKEGTVILWDLQADRPRVELSLGVTQAVRQLAFSRDGSRLAVLHYGGIITLWEIAVTEWLALARTIANRNLTRDEWEQYLKRGNETYEEYVKL